MAMQS